MIGQGSTLNLRIGECCLAQTFWCLEMNSIEWALSEQCMSTEISELNLSVKWNKLYWWKSGSATGFLSGTSITIFFYIVLFHKNIQVSLPVILKSKQKEERWIALFSSRRNNWTKGTSKLTMRAIDWTLKTQPVCKATYNTATSHTGCTLLLLLIKFNHQPVCLCWNFFRPILEIPRTHHRFCMHWMPFILNEWKLNTSCGHSWVLWDNNCMTDEHQTDITFSHEDLACGLSLLCNALKITNNTDPRFILLLYVHD